MTGYHRELFGQPWHDTDHNGCDQRSDVLIRDAQLVTRDPRRPCQIVTISLVDPYAGATLTSTRDIEIDHVVPLAAAWRAGAADWDAGLRERFATDLDNLLATQQKVNRSKSDQTPDTWRPAASTAYCRYATIYIIVSKRYLLTVSEPIRDALADLAGHCP
jgi:hypothetical protein